jgi:hypothetical protein
VWAGMRRSDLRFIPSVLALVFLGVRTYAGSTIARRLSRLFISLSGKSF